MKRIEPDMLTCSRNPERPTHRKMHYIDTIAVGGGVAGLSILWQLATRAPEARQSSSLLLLEREAVCGSAASGRNAGIFRQIEADEVSTKLALRSGEIFGSLSSSSSLVTETGALYIARENEALKYMLRVATKQGVVTQTLRHKTLCDFCSLIAGGEAQQGLLVPGDGVVDVHALLESLRRGALDRGARVSCRSTVTGVLTKNARVSGVLLGSGEEIACRRLVIATGAWAKELGASVGASMPLEPLRRHMVFLQGEKPSRPNDPVVWRVDEQVYIRPESSGYLASPCDEKAWPPVVEPETDQAALFDLAQLLSKTTPPVSGSMVRRIWAGLRTFAPDRLPVIGPDPKIEGLYWFAGLGGQGISIALGASELLAELMEEREHPLAGPLSPGRSMLSVEPIFGARSAR